MRYKQATGTFYGSDDFSAGPRISFTTNRAVFAIDLEKIGNQALFTGVSTRAGDIVTITFTGVTGIVVGAFALVHMVVDNIANLHGGGCDILE